MAEAQALCAGADLLLCVGSSLEVYPGRRPAGADAGRRRQGRDRHPGPDAVRRRGAVRLDGDVVDELGAVLAALYGAPAATAVSPSARLRRSTALAAAAASR